MAAELRAISLGAGVQSTTMYLMACHGEFAWVPDMAVFADTQWEPEAVYEHLTQLEEAQFPIPIYRVTAGDLRADSSQKKKRFASIPLFVAHPETGKLTKLRRQCTKEYKIYPIRRFIRERFLDGQVRGKKIELWLGISVDEAHRMKPANVQWVEHRWPLIDKGMSRRDCIAWLEAHGYAVPPKSSCIGCPYHDDGYWRRLKDESPDEFQDAVEFDRSIRRLPRIKGDAFLHRSLRPLDEVELDPHRDQADLFGEECEGMCGV